MDIRPDERTQKSCRMSLMVPAHPAKKIEESNGIHALPTMISMEQGEKTYE